MLVHGRLVMKRIFVDAVVGDIFHQGVPHWCRRATAVLSVGLCTLALVQLLNYDQQLIGRSLIAGSSLKNDVRVATLDLSRLTPNGNAPPDGVAPPKGEIEPMLLLSSIILPSKHSLLRSSTATAPHVGFTPNDPSQTPQISWPTTLISPLKTASSPSLASDHVCGNHSSKLTYSELGRLSNLFAPVITQFEKDRLLELLHVLDNALRTSGIPYIIYGGTLLGAWRHRGIIPWDDDVDVLVSFSDAKRLQAALKSLPDHRLHTSPWWRYKFYHANHSDAISGRSWRWPFIDVCFYGVNGTHLYDVDPELRDTWAWPPHVVLPATSAKYEDLVVPAPRDIAKFLTASYNITMCETRIWSHRDEVYAPGDRYVTVPCWKLYGLFVFYCYQDDGIGGD